MENISETPKIEYVPTAKIVIDKGYGLQSEPLELTADQLSAVYKSQPRLVNRIDEFEKAQEKAREYLVDNHEDLGEHAEKIARILGVELTREVTVYVTVEFELSLSLEPSQSVDDVVSDITFDAELWYGNEATLNSAEVTDTNWQEA